MDSDASGNAYQYPLSYTHHQGSPISGYHQYVAPYSDQAHSANPSFSAQGHVSAQRSQQQEQSQQYYHARQNFQSQTDQKDQEYLEQLFNEQRQRHQLTQQERHPYYSQHSHHTQHQQSQQQPQQQQQQQKSSPTKPAPIQQTGQPSETQQSQARHYSEYNQSNHQHAQYQQSNIPQQQSGYQQQQQQAQRKQGQHLQQGSFQQQHQQHQLHQLHQLHQQPRTTHLQQRKPPDVRLQLPARATISQNHPRHLHNPLITTTTTTATSSLDDESQAEKQSAADTLASVATAHYGTSNQQQQQGWKAKSSSVGHTAQQWPSQSENSPRTQLEGHNAFQPSGAIQKSGSAENFSNQIGHQQSQHSPNVYSNNADSSSARVAQSSVSQNQQSQNLNTSTEAQSHTYGSSSMPAQRHRVVPPVYSAAQYIPATTVEPSPAVSGVTSVSASTSIPESQISPAASLQSDQVHNCQNVATTNPAYSYSVPAAIDTKNQHRLHQTSYQHKKTPSNSSISGTRGGGPKNISLTDNRTYTITAQNLEDTKKATEYLPTTETQQQDKHSQLLHTKSPVQVARQSPLPQGQAGAYSQTQNSSYNQLPTYNTQPEQRDKTNLTGAQWQNLEVERETSATMSNQSVGTDNTGQNSIVAAPPVATKQRAPSKPRKPRAPRQPKQKEQKTEINKKEKIQASQYQATQAAETLSNFGNQQPLGYSTDSLNAVAVQQSSAMPAQTLSYQELQDNPIYSPQQQQQQQQQQQSFNTPLSTQSQPIYQSGIDLTQTSEVQAQPAPKKPKQPRRQSKAKSTVPNIKQPFLQRQEQASHDQSTISPQFQQNEGPQKQLPAGDSQTMDYPQYQSHHQQYNHHGSQLSFQSQRGSQTPQEHGQGGDVSSQLHASAIPSSQAPVQQYAAQPQKSSNVTATPSKRKRAAEKKSRESARTNASVSNLISPEQQAFPSMTASVPARMEDTSHERNKMEQDMRDMVEKMREYQSRDPAAFQAIWEHVKRSDGGRAQRSPSLPVARPHEKVQSPQIQASNTVAVQCAIAAPQPSLPINDMQQTQRTSVAKQLPVSRAPQKQKSQPSDVPTKQISPQLSSQQTITPSQASLTGNQKNQICQSIVDFLSQVAGGPKPVPRDMIMKLLEKSVMPSFRELCTEFESYGYRFNKKALAEELLKSFPESGHTIGSRGMTTSDSITQQRETTTAYLDTSLSEESRPLDMGTTSHALQQASNVNQTSSVLRANPPYHTPSNLQNPTVPEHIPDTVLPTGLPSRYASTPDTKMNDPVAPLSTQTLDPSVFRATHSYLHHQLPRNPTPQSIRSLQSMAFDGQKTSVIPQTTEPEGHYITPALIYKNPIPPLSTSFSRSLHHQSNSAETRDSIVMEKPTEKRASTEVTVASEAELPLERQNTGPITESNADENVVEMEDAPSNVVHESEEVDNEKHSSQPETPKSLIVELKLSSAKANALLRVLKFRSDYEAQMLAARNPSQSSPNPGKAEPTSKILSPLNDKAGDIDAGQQASQKQSSDNNTPTLSSTGTPSNSKPKESKALNHSLPPVPSFSKEQARKTNSYNPSNIARAVLIATGRHPTEKGINSAFVPWLDFNPPLASYHSDIAQIPWEVYDPNPGHVAGCFDVEDGDPMDIDDDSAMNSDVLGFPGDDSAMVDARTRPGRGRGRGKAIITSSSYSSSDVGGGLVVATPRQRGKRGRPRGSKNSASKAAHTQDMSGNGTLIQTPEQNRSGATPRGSGRGRPRGRPRGRGVSSYGMTPNSSEIGGSFRKRRFSGDGSDPPGSGSQIRRNQASLRSYQCQWLGCEAELHNYDTLKQHVLRKHKEESANGTYKWLWKGCRKSDDETSRKEFDDSVQWDEHMLGDHLESIRIAFGNGPEGGIVSSPLSHMGGLEDSVRRMSVDREGRQVTPIASPAPRGYQFTPPPGFRPNDEFRIAHAEDDLHAQHDDIIERIRLVGAGMEPSGESPREFYDGTLEFQSRRLIRRDDDDDFPQLGMAFLMQRGKIEDDIEATIKQES